MGICNRVEPSTCTYEEIVSYLLRPNSVDTDGLLRSEEEGKLRRLALT